MRPTTVGATRSCASYWPSSSALTWLGGPRHGPHTLRSRCARQRSKASALQGIVVMLDPRGGHEICQVKLTVASLTLLPPLSGMGSLPPTPASFPQAPSFCPPPSATRRLPRALLVAVRHEQRATSRRAPAPPAEDSPKFGRVRLTQPRGKGESATPRRWAMATAKARAACLLVVWALVAADLCLARASLAAAALGKEQREFDYFALALQWPGTICPSTRYCCAINGCCRPEPLQTFTIHGLWPDYDDGTWPSCCRETNYDADKILSLKPVMDLYWPSLYCSTSSTCFSGKGPFWAHEVILSELPALTLKLPLLAFN
ncbi:hypothetical protein QYE76_057019 [Lolium multiflorum]|uniref:Uncharacterized protein n=1 Tax=Lolium multiflorum TaxID=4521 RepID=A0AAD8WR24_LOLMU|nr:hypothetical protein QYE76_057019 [Lolium multiflorum]